MLTTLVNTLMSAEADAICGAPYGMPGPDRVNVRNGYWHRNFDTRTGTLDVAIPKLRSGSYFPDWLLERRRRAEATLTSVVADLLPAGSLDPPDGEAGIVRRWRFTPCRRVSGRRWVAGGPGRLMSCSVSRDLPRALGWG
jgi:hypothetical protein